MVSATWEQVRARRLARQHLLAPAHELGIVAHDTCGIHAQVQASAELQLAARTTGLTQEDVRDALWRDRTLAKAWTLRGTLHLHPASELAFWLAARRAVVAGKEGDGLGAWVGPDGREHPPVGADELTELQAAVWDAFDGRPLLRDELTTKVVARVGAKHEARLRSGFAFFVGSLCQGPPQGNKITFVRPDQWVDGWGDVDADGALREVVRRYLATYGPARPADIRAWLGADVSFDGIDVEEVDVEGHRAFVLSDDTAFPAASTSVRLLPEYDVYVMGFRERDHLVPERVRDQVAAHGRGRYEGPAGVRFVLVDGVAAGSWDRKKLSKRIEITVKAAQRIKRQAVADEVERYARFLELEPVLRVE